jgi:3D (Asp-Asp-Asp) domain-containing protein
LRSTNLPLSAVAAFLAALTVSLFTGCETGPTATAVSTRQLPSFESRMAKSNFQNVRTTAYTHTEADHTQFGARNALGGELHAAGPGVRRAENTRPISLGDNVGSNALLMSYTAPKQPFSPTDKLPPRKAVKPAKKEKTASKSPRIGSAAADWGRWPAGTTFRLVSTGQVYRVDDYGWALSGRNTIDLYMSNQREMNTWGVRQEPIEVLHWGSTQESLRLLAPHAEHKHIKRMMLELQGRDAEAAALH